MKITRLFVMLLVLLLTASLTAQDNAAKEKFNAGIAARNAKNLAEAEKQFIAATTAFPQYKEAWKELGAVRCDLKKWVPAEEAFQKAVSIDPKYQSAIYYLGMAQIQSKKYSLAEGNLKKSLELKPGDPDAQKGLGLLYFEQRMWDKSIEYYQMYNSANSTDAKSHFSMAKAYKEKGDFENAEKEYQQATRIDPKFSDAFFNYGNLLGTKAEQYYSAAQVAEEKGNSAEAEKSKQEAEKKSRAAISAYKSALAIDRGLVKAYINMALNYSKIQQWPEALQAYKDFVRLAEGKPAFKGQVQQVKTDIIPKLEEAIQGGQ